MTTSTTKTLKPADAGLMNALVGRAHFGVSLYLAVGADLNCRLEDGLRPIFYTVYRDDPAGLLMLLQRGADPNAAADDGLTALMMCGERDNRVCAGLLLSFGADPNASDPEWGHTALHHAAMAGSADCFTYLLNHPRCNPHQRNHQGDRAVDIGATPEIVAAFESWQAAHPPVWSWE